MTTLSSPIIQKIYKGKKSRSGKTFLTKRLAGIIIAGVVDGEVGVGYSLLHNNDRYDFVKGQRKPGFGKSLATDRAIKSLSSGKLEVPPSIVPLMNKFLARCDVYYKDAKRVVDVSVMDVNYYHQPDGRTTSIPVEEM